MKQPVQTLFETCNEASYCIADWVFYPQKLKGRQDVRVSDSIETYRSIHKNKGINSSKVNTQRRVSTKENETTFRKTVLDAMKPSFADCCNDRKLVKREMVKPNPKRAVIYNPPFYPDGPLGHKAVDILIEMLKCLGRSTWWRVCERWRNFDVQRDNLSKDPFIGIIDGKDVKQHLSCLGLVS